MRPQDFRAGQSALGLMAHNTQTMLAPRMAQWEAFGRGFKDANAIIQNRQAFNEQMEQNKINNAFKERQFGFQESQAQEDKRRFDENLAENKRQFEKRHALERQNSATDRNYKNAQIAALHHNINKENQASNQDAQNWIIAEELKKKWITDPASLTLQETDFLAKHGFKVGDPNNKIAVRTMTFHEKYNSNEKALRNIKDVIEDADTRGTFFGLKRWANRASGGLVGLSEKENKHLVAINNVIDAIIKNQYGNQSSEQKEQKRKQIFDALFASPEQFKARLGEMAKDIMLQQEADLLTLQEFGITKDSLGKYNQKLENNKTAFESFANSTPKNAKEVKRYNPRDYILPTK